MGVVNRVHETEPTIHIVHKHRNRWGRSGHGLTTFWAATIKWNQECGSLRDVSHPLLMYAIARSWSLRPPWSTYYCASGKMSDTAVGIRSDCWAYSLHKHLAWPLQFCFLRLCSVQCTYFLIKWDGHIMVISEPYYTFTCRTTVKILNLFMAREIS